MIHLKDYVVQRSEFRLEISELILQGRKNFIIGKNGSGKTTLLQSLAGLLESSGIFEVNGTNKTGKAPERRNVGYIPQDLLLFGRMSVENNLMTPIKYGNGDIEIYEQLVERMGLTPLLLKKSSDISLGQAQKAAIARAIISRPSILLMDEPFSFQDEIARLGLISLIDEFSRKYGFDYIYATHDSRDLETGFSNLVSIDDGRIIESVDSLSKIEHFRTLSLLDYKNLASVEGHYFALTETALEFNDISGSEYDIVGLDRNRYIRFNLNGTYFFASINSTPQGRFVKLNTSNAREMEY
ncbi:MAG: ATP-binding cassette domain-containing protein [Thermoplasmatales archaeon]|nr:ATP-binding cassette domain-containing protein [Candidatus Thermoplasmatota archaeon]MCL6002746.1 ATP-binding cassette domain-containing protein [Candidatus Thermoplasmatota archaeon]MDA8054237.1 ATP-binding cassette domain-containing protein [Thermoplasmatales archaeon]